MRTFRQVHVENFLSLQSLDLSFADLNVLVGPNGAGKTNILKIFEFLGEVARRELVPAIQEIGGFDQLLYRGVGTKPTSRVEIKLRGVITKWATENALDEYTLNFSRHAGVVGRGRELIRRTEELKFKRYRGPGRRITLTGGRVNVTSDGGAARDKQLELEIQGEATGLGTLRRLSNAYGASQWNAFAEVVEDLRLFDIAVDAVRRPSRPERKPKLRPDASNLASFLAELAVTESEAFEEVVEDVRAVLPSFEGLEFIPIAGSDDAIRVDIKERNLRETTPLARASFGTIRALALFTMLHDPHPPRLTCLEEIDHGLHPHALDRIVSRLREASLRTQIIVATHSPPLVNRLKPEELIIVERNDDGSTRAFRPDANMVHQVEDETGYQLGELWFSGLLGGGL
jgi:predicted ATPase